MIIHMDMDAFYAAVEQLDQPALRGKPVIVGGRSKRAVVSTASYEARKYGVRSAMPMFQALALCPQAIVVPVRMERYQMVSAEVMTILAEFSPLVEQVGIDEAFVDIRGTQTLLGDPRTIALAIKTRIRAAIGLTCSIGLAPLKFLAKIASDMQKPDGLTIISPDQTAAFINELAIEKVPGVGPATLVQLKSMGIRRLGDVARVPEKQLQAKLGKAALRLTALARGLDDSEVMPFRPVKSMGAENTLGENTSDLNLLKKHLLMHAERVGRELRSGRAKARSLQLKIKFADFKQITRSTMLEKPTQSSESLYAAAVQLLLQTRLPKPVRLIGISASNLVSSATPVQQDLIQGEAEQKWEKLDHTLDSIAERFGNHMIAKATLTEKEK